MLKKFPFILSFILLLSVNDSFLSFFCKAISEKSAQYCEEIIEDEVLLELIAMPNVIVTSHQAYLTNEALDNIASTTMSNLDDFLSKGYGDNELCYGCGKVDECMKNRNKKCF